MARRSLSQGARPARSAEGSDCRCYLLLLVLLCLAGCGATKGRPQLCSAGIGSKTLTVKAIVTASNLLEDGSPTQGNFITNLQVDVMRSEQPVTDADVRFSGSFGTKSINPASSDSGRYVLSMSGYATMYTLSIQAGNDYIENAFCTGPDIHAITYPTTGTTYSPGTDLTVTWSRTTTADNVVISASRFDSSMEGTPASDTGAYTLSAKLWTPTPPSETVAVTRNNTVDLSGSATGDSFLRIQVNNSVKFSVRQ